MKNTIKAIVVVSALVMGSNALAADSKFVCDFPIFHAYTAKGNKEVKLCVSGEKVSYTFGKRDIATPEMDITVNKINAHFYNFRYGDEGTVSNGTYVYSVSEMNDENGKRLDELTVFKGEKKLATIPFSKILINNMNSDLENYGLEVE